MTTIDAPAQAIELPGLHHHFNEAELAAAAFLARYGGRTLEAYRHDLRSFFQWAADVGLEVLEATRPHIELFRSAMEARGLAQPPSTVGSRPSAASTDSPILTAGSARTRRSTCGAHRSTAPMGAASTESSWAASSSPPSPTTTTTPPLRCCWG